MNDMELRDRRVVFYENDIQQIEKIMQKFIKLTKAKCVLLVDKDGHMITRVGGEITFDQDTISALVAGSFAATKEMARLLGENEFSALYHQGRSDNIQLSLVGDRTILTVIFNENTTLGMIRLYVAETVRKLQELFIEADKSKNEKKPGVAVTIAKEYNSSAQDKLDSLFDE